MELLGQSVGPFCARWADLLVGSAWKGTVLVAVAALLLRCVPRLSAGVRSAIWTAVLVLVMALPVLSSQAPLAAAGERTLVQASAAWSVALVGVWAGLSMLRLLQLGASALRLGAIARRAVRVEAPEAVRELLVRDRRKVSLCVSGDVSRPSVAGFLQPRILLPVGLLEELTGAELQHVVLHELEHLRRRDDWTNLLQKLSLALFPLHPALHWIDRQMCRERELACDDGVLRATRARKAYAACLARLAEDSMMRRGLLLALGLLGVRSRSSELGGRVQRILRSPGMTMGRAQVGLATGALLSAVMGGCLLLARSPRLISFADGAPASVAQTGSAPKPTAAGPMDAAPVSAPLRAIPVKMVMPSSPQGAPRLIRVQAPPRARSRSTLRRVAAVQPPVQMSASYLVVTAWRQEIAPPRLTLAVAQDGADAQPSFAAVPVRGGWLLIQL